MIFTLQVPGPLSKDTAEQLALASFSVGVPAASWMRRAETASSPTESPELDIRPAGKGTKS